MNSVLSRKESDDLRKWITRGDLVALKKGGLFGDYALDSNDLRTFMKGFILTTLLTFLVLDCLHSGGFGQALNKTPVGLYPETFCWSQIERLKNDTTAISNSAVMEFNGR